MRKHGIEPCFYIVLNMDCAEARSTVEEYYGIQRDMLTELLTGYGPIPRMWWDMVSSNLAPQWNPGGFPALFKNLSAHAKALAPRTMLLPGERREGKLYRVGPNCEAWPNTLTEDAY